jgi:hypothetical protein
LNSPVQNRRHAASSACRTKLANLGEQFTFDPDAEMGSEPRLATHNDKVLG